MDDSLAETVAVGSWWRACRMAARLKVVNRRPRLGIVLIVLGALIALGRRGTSRSGKCATGLTCLPAATESPPDLLLRGV